MLLVQYGNLARVGACSSVQSVNHARAYHRSAEVSIAPFHIFPLLSVFLPRSPSLRNSIPLVRIDGPATDEVLIRSWSKITLLSCSFWFLV